MGKRLSHPSPKDISDGLKNIRDNSKNIQDSPEDIHDCPSENPRQSEEEWIEAQPPSLPLPAL